MVAMLVLVAMLTLAGVVVMRMDSVMARVVLLAVVAREDTMADTMGAVVMRVVAVMVWGVALVW